MRKITIHLKSRDSEELRKFLEKQGFALFKLEPMLSEVTRYTYNRKIIDINCKDDSYEYLAIYNGEKTLEQLGINLSKLEEKYSNIVVEMVYSVSRQE